MTEKLCILCCANFAPEIRAAVAAEGWHDVTVAAFPPRCGKPPLSWDELRPMVEKDCTHVAILGRSCLQGLGATPAGWPPVRLLVQNECFHLVAAPQLVDEAISRGAYLATPAWLHDWRNQLRQLGFDEASAPGFFQDFARELVLLDTGTMPDAPGGVLRQLNEMHRDWRWTEEGTGFLLRVAHGEETLGVILADRFAFPAYRARYLNLALSLAGVCGLAIENARTYQRIKKTEEALRKSEHSLKMAQAVAHLGHWEWDMHSGEMRWSDETYRLLGYRPEAHQPNRELFLQVIHPDDRAKVAEEISKAHAGGGFDLEYRIVLADGRIRVLHGLGEVISQSDAATLQLFGTIRDVTSQQPEEVLGVIQDITERKELEWKLAEEAHTDALTGCANRRYFLESARQELSRVRRYNRALSVLMLDLDHFKVVNDEHGHHVGDLVLQKLVEVCTAILREADVVGRLGGEEFAVLLPETGAMDALEAGERVRAAVANAVVPLENGTPLRVTTSVGVATLSPDIADIETLLARADGALYAAKHAGRNRVMLAGPQP